MDEVTDSGVAATRSHLTASALSLGSRLDFWSLALAIVALLCALLLHLSLGPTFCLVLSFLAAVMQKIFAMRVAFDEEIFRGWAEKWSATKPDSSISYKDDLSALDQTLIVYRLVSSKATATRGLDIRALGALGLLKKQIIAFLFQSAAMLIAVLLHV